MNLKSALSPQNFVLAVLFFFFPSKLMAAEPGNTPVAPKSRGLLLVANKGDQTMGIIDPATGKQIATVAEDGITGHELVASPDGKRAFVPIYGNSGVGKPGTDGQVIRVIDLATRQIVGTV